MNRMPVALALCALLSVAGSSWAKEKPNPEDHKIKELQLRQANAWNRHDAAAYTGLFTDDADVVNVLGWWWQGRDEIQRKLMDAFAYTFRESTMTIIDTNIKYLSKTVAVVHVDWTMTGARMPPGFAEPKQGIQLQVLEKVKGSWKIRSFQNTLSVPAADFPKGPPTSQTPR